MHIYTPSAIADLRRRIVAGGTAAAAFCNGAGLGTARGDVGGAARVLKRCRRRQRRSAGAGRQTRKVC